MRRTVLLVLSTLAVVLVAATCANGDTSEELEESQAGGVTAAGEAGTGDADTPTSIARESEQRPEQPSPDPALEPAPVRLGDRFEWCADIQRDWDGQAQIQAQVDAAIAAWRNAVGSYEAATDELDKAEALNLVESAELRYSDLSRVLVAANGAVVAPVRPSWQGVDETQAIALERAREALQLSADQDLLELIEIAYPASLAGEPATAEPSAGDETAPLVPHGGVVSQRPEAWDEEGALEANLADLARLQEAVVSWSAEFWSAIQETESAVLDIDEAQSPSDAIAAHERLHQVAPMSQEAQEVGWSASDTAETLRQSYVLSARQALQADTMSAEEYRSGLIDVEATVRAILERIQHIYGSDDAARLIGAGSLALQEATNRFVLADKPAWTAFQGSLSESCRPKP